MSVKRGPGRPRSSENPLDRERIISAATELLVEQGQRMSVRAVARTLKVDPMALYTYFPDREAIEEAVATTLMSSLPEPRAEAGWREELCTLIRSYIDLLVRHRGLLETIVHLGARAQGPATVFRERFLAATTQLELESGCLNAALDLIVDYVHGFVLAFECNENGSLSVDDAAGAIDFYLQALESQERGLS